LGEGLGFGSLQFESDVGLDLHHDETLAPGCDVDSGEPMREVITVGRASAVVLAITVVIGAAVSAPATAGKRRQLSAKQAPQVSGPLEQINSRCKEQKERFRDEVVATGRSCIRIYSFAPASEDDAGRDYGVAWLQSTLDPERGWCGLDVHSDITLPNDVAVTAKTPRRRSEFNEKTFRRTRLKPDADGNASEAAAISQGAFFYPRLLTRKMRSNGGIYRLAWDGSSNRKLAFVSGVELSWPSDNPPGGISFALNYELGQDAKC
jgi:hypothetical protein